MCSHEEGMLLSSLATQRLCVRADGETSTAAVAVAVAGACAETVVQVVHFRGVVA
jgi:hypothetical protein